MPGADLMTDAGLRILVVGGLGADVQAVDAGVRGLGLSVHWVEPADVPAQLAAADILVIVLDLDGTGLALARRVRESEATRHTPLLFLTADDTPPEVRAQADALAPANCLTRPVTPEVVRAQVELVLELRRNPVGPLRPELEAAIRD